MSGGGGGGGARGPSGPVPASARKLVQGLKEIVNRPDAEIYAALRECDMDPDEAVSRLLSQGHISCHSPFPHRFVCRLGRYCRVFACLTVLDECALGSLSIASGFQEPCFLLPFYLGILRRFATALLVFGGDCASIR